MVKNRDRNRPIQGKNDEDSIAVVEAYIKRKLVRPKTTWSVPALLFLLMLLLPIGAGYAITIIFSLLNAALCYLLCYLIIDLILLRVLLIKLVRCYQHYAKEELRRFCMCMPSCSEYAIGVLKRYPLVIAIFKIIYRLTKTCDGEMKIDMP